jgi:hypothetical protein
MSDGLKYINMKYVYETYGFSPVSCLNVSFYEANGDDYYFWEGEVSYLKVNVTFPNYYKRDSDNSHAGVRIVRSVRNVFIVK